MSETLTAKDIAYTMHAHQIKMEDVQTEHAIIFIKSVVAEHEFEYVGQAKIKISNTVTVLSPFTLKVVTDDAAQGMDTLFNHLHARYKRSYPSLLDVTLDIKTVNKVK